MIGSRPPTAPGSVRIAVISALCAIIATTSTAPPIRPPPSTETTVLTFTLPELEARREDEPAEFKVWSTQYFIPVVTVAGRNEPDTHPFIDTDGRPISPPLTRKDWCSGVLQGSINIRTESGDVQSYSYVDSRGPEQVDCDRWLGSLSSEIKSASRRARFRLRPSEDDCEARARPLTPFRTIAVDPNVIPLGSVVFIGELRGAAFQRDGQILIHDGFLIADDFGGAVEGNHIDLFTTGEEEIPLPDFVSNSHRHTVTARLAPPSSPQAIALKATLARACEIR